MFKTTYLESTGLSVINQSTVNDLAKLATYIYFNHPEILEISRQKETEITELKSNKARKLLSINKFAGEPDFIGGKTGYIEESLGRNLIALFEINGKTVLTITLGADDSFEETARLKEFVQNCQK
jgi:D-alanyl-D-alanine carboxypeptidase